MKPRTLSVVRTVVAALALTVFGTASAGENGAEIIAANDNSNAIARSTAQSGQPESGFHLDSLSLNVYGLAYHPDRDKVHRQHLDNEFNPGLGLRYDLRSDARGITFTELGAYRDSGRNWAKFASLGYQFKLDEHWRIGGALAAFNSQTYNRGITFLAMIPLATYDLGRLQLNAVYIPKFGHYNNVDAFGFYITIPIGKWAR